MNIKNTCNLQFLELLLKGKSFRLLSTFHSNIQQFISCLFFFAFIGKHLNRLIKIAVKKVL